MVRPTVEGSGTVAQPQQTQPQPSRLQVSAQINYAVATGQISPAEAESLHRIMSGTASVTDYATLSSLRAIEIEAAKPTFLPSVTPGRDVLGTKGVQRVYTTDPIGNWTRSIYETWFVPIPPGDIKTAERIYKQRAEQAEVAGIGLALSAPFLSYAVEKYGPKVTGKLSEIYRFSHVAKGVTKAESFVQRRIPFWKFYEPFKKEIARGEFGIPSFERFGIPELKAERVAWESMRTPRMGGVMISRGFGGAASKDSFSYLMKGIGGWVTREATFTPLISQTVLTRTGIQPYRPSKPFLSTELLTRQELFGMPEWTSRSLALGLAGLFRFPTKMITVPSFKKTVWTSPRLFQTPSRRQVPGKKESLIQPVRLSEVQTPIQTQIQQQRQEQVQSVRQILKQVQTPFGPSIPKMSFRPYFPQIPRGSTGSSGGRGSRGLFGQWFKKRQAIKTPQQMLETFFGTPKRARKRRKK